MDEDKISTVDLVTDAKILNVTFSTGSTAEDLCIKICKELGIGPVTRHLFALRHKSTGLWYPPGYKLDNKDKIKFEFRMRFKPTTLKRLKEIDEKSYDYYFLQVRSDVLENKVPDIVFDRHKPELIGLGVCDMYRVMLEKNVPREIVESDYKKYIPKECIKRHSWFIKKPIQNELARISEHDASYVKESYLNQFESIAPNYPYEEYKALMDKGIPNPPSKVLLRITATDMKFSENGNNQWSSLCAIEDLCFISIRQDCTVEISRKNGIPSYLKFAKNSLLMSFVSCLDGYYRLGFKWTFNLCRDVVTPSLERLYKLKCHGPVGGEFSYAKLEGKRSNRHGTFILRESETKYNVLYLDSCGKDNKPKTYKIEQRGSEEFILSDFVETYKSLRHLISSHQDKSGSLYLSECIPPSEYDNSPLLLCAVEGVGGDVAADEEIITALLEGGPRCICPRQFQVYKAQPFPKTNDYGEVRVSPTTLYRAMWRVTKGKKLEAAIKVLNQEESNLTKEFLELAGKWGQLRSGALVRLYGLTMGPAAGMLMELVKLGPLDEYLRKSSPQTIKTVDMVEAAACLATALWYLEENGVVHGNIRCRKLLVHAHTDNSFTVKLADPGLFSYTQSDIHWLPPECYMNPELAKRSTKADVWAVGTTFWQIFSRGAISLADKDVESVKRYYTSGKRLPIPSGCPSEVYKLMIDCWGDSGGLRKQPQAIMRDINQILYQVYNSRRTHAYATAYPRLFTDHDKLDEDEPTKENDSSSGGGSRTSSLVTDRTSLPWDDTDDSEGRLIGFSDTDPDAEAELSAYLGWLAENGRNGDSLSISRPILHRDMDNNGEDSGLLHQIQGIFELDANCNVILQGRIGQGFYGDVYRGTLERDNAKDYEPQQVAVKKLKTKALNADVRDFEREIEIMTTLKHPNIVEILGVIQEPEICLVMEFVKHGSLQSYLAIHRETLSHKRLLGFSLNIATGMDYLGRKNIVHRDLAARNILVAEDDRVKISDFGLAQVTGKNDYYILQTCRDLPIKWYAPESLRDGKFSTRSDVWSFGVTMFETFGFGEDPELPGVGKETNGENGGEANAEILSALERGTRLPCPPNCPQTIYTKLMYPCWNWQSHERPKFSMLCDNIRDLIDQY